MCPFMIFLMSQICVVCSNVYPKVDDCAGTITQVVQHDFKSRQLRNTTQWSFSTRFMENVTTAFSIPCRCLKYVAIFDSVTQDVGPQE